MTPQLFIVHVWNSEDTLALQDFYVGLCACVRACALVHARHAGKSLSGRTSRPLVARPLPGLHISPHVSVRAVFMSLAR